MKAYDLHVHSIFSEGKNTLEEIASTAKILGYQGFCLTAYFKGMDQIKELKEEIEKVSKGIEIFLGFEARNQKELEKLVAIRKKYDLLLVGGGDLELNRIACETPEVDILTHPEIERSDSGLNHVLVNLAAKNNVAIEINFREILFSSKKTRSRIISNISRNVKLAQKFHAPLVLCSGAVSKWELRDPQALASFATLLGMSFSSAKDSISTVPEKILKQSKERRSENWILPGVKVVK